MTQNCSYFDECSARDGEYEYYTSGCLLDTSFSWDPIVNPELFGPNSNFGSTRKNSAPNSLLIDDCCDVDEICSVNDCFPGMDR